MCWKFPLTYRLRGRYLWKIFLFYFRKDSLYLFIYFIFYYLAHSHHSKCFYTVSYAIHYAYLYPQSFHSIQHDKPSNAYHSLIANHIHSHTNANTGLIVNSNKNNAKLGLMNNIIINNNRIIYFSFYIEHIGIEPIRYVVVTIYSTSCHLIYGSWLI